MSIKKHTKEPPAGTGGSSRVSFRRLCGLDDLAVAIIATVAADAVRKLHLAALGAGATGRCGQLHVRAMTGMMTGAAGFPLGYCHDLSPLRRAMLVNFQTRTSSIAMSPRRCKKYFHPSPPAHIPGCSGTTGSGAFVPESQDARQRHLTPLSHGLQVALGAINCRT